MIELDTIYNEDCLQGMKRIPDGSVDAVICDPPFGTTDNVWDNALPFDKLWEQYWRILKPNGAVVLFGQEPFASHCRLSTPYFRYDWIWRKTMGAGFLNAKFDNTLKAIRHRRGIDELRLTRRISVTIDPMSGREKVQIYIHIEYANE